MTDNHTDDIRDLLARAMSDAPQPHDWADVEQRAWQLDAPSPPRRRTGVWLAAAACTIALVGGLVALEARDEDPLQPVDTGVVTVPVTTSTPTPTTGPPDALIPPESTEQSETETADPGSEQPPSLPRPVPGQTQRSVVGDITWTLIEGDASNVPQGPVIGVDGGYLGGVYDGRTWRSSDGIEWELVDVGGDGVADESVYGEFEFGGETWAQTNDGLARWDGETFVPVTLPESRFADLDGLGTVHRSVGAPVVVGEELVVPVTTELEVPWRELFAGSDVRGVWEGDPQSIRIVDMTREEDVAVLSAAFVDGEPGRFEFRDAENNELVTTVEATPGVDPAVLLPRIVNGEYREILIGDADGFEAVDPPGGWGAPGGLDGGVVPIDGGVLAIARVGNQTQFGIDGGGLGPDDWELWTSTDARSWTQLDLPAPARSLIDNVAMASDGSAVLLRIDFRVAGQLPRQTKWWSSVDGSRWEAIDTIDLMESGFSGIGMKSAEFGWLFGDAESEIALSADGRTWQAVRFDFPRSLGGGTFVVDRSIFVVPAPELEGTDDATYSMWVGRVADG